MSQEYKLHVAIVAHIESAFMGPHNPNLKYWHTANQSRDATEAFFNKKMGVLPGISDLIFSWPHPSIEGAVKMGALEIKTKDGKFSSAQNRFLSWGRSIGWSVGEARTAKAAHMVLCSWGLRASHTSILEPDLRTKPEKFQDVHNFYQPASTSRAPVPLED